MAEDGSSIRFNDCIKSERCEYQVQTEVIGGKNAKILTTVMAEGAVRYSDRQPYPGHVQDLERVRAIIEVQHLQVVDKVTRGEIE